MYLSSIHFRSRQMVISCGIPLDKTYDFIISPTWTKFWVVNTINNKQITVQVRFYQKNSKWTTFSGPQTKRTSCMHSKLCFAESLSQVARLLFRARSGIRWTKLGGLLPKFVGQDTAVRRLRWKMLVGGKEEYHVAYFTKNDIGFLTSTNTGAFLLLIVLVSDDYLN